MTKKQQGIALIVLAIVGGLILLALLGWAVASIFGALSVGAAGKALKEYAETERNRDLAKQTIEDAKRQQLAQVSKDAKEAMERRTERKKADEAGVKQTVKRAETKADLDTAIDKEAASLDAFFVEEGGYIRPIILLFGIVFMLLVGALFPGAPAARAPTSRERARAEKILKVLKRARRTIEQLRERQRLQLRRLQIQHQAALQKAGAVLRACQQQKTLIAQHLNPPMWPWLLFGIAVGGATVGGAWGVVAISRGMK